MKTFDEVTSISWWSTSFGR